jgi:phytoene synthase
MSDALRHMSRGGKTFYFASMWLDRPVRNDAAVAYSFCRMVDDIADNLPAGQERSHLLDTLLDAIRTDNRNNPNTREILALTHRFPQIREPVQNLIQACSADIPGIRIHDTDQLLRYAYGVAGTVGLIMYPILGGKDPVGERFAADLGIAMQCTNIARDIVSDLKENRIYLPSEWLGSCDLHALLRADVGVERKAVSATRKLLALGDEHYSRGLGGLSYLAPRCRFAIRVAATCYAAIGARVIQNDRISRKRVVVPLHTKILLMLQSSRFLKMRTNEHLPESVY